MEKGSQIRINFIRHSEQENGSNDSKLTFQGLEEATKLAHYLSVNKEQALGISPSILRSVLTTFATVSPQNSIQFLGEIEALSKKKVLIKYGVPFTPSFLFGLIGLIYLIYRFGMWL